MILKLIASLIGLKHFDLPKELHFNILKMFIHLPTILSNEYCESINSKQIQVGIYMVLKWS